MALPIPNYPITNKSYLYVQGLNISWVDGTNITLAAGQARDSRNINDIVLSADVNIDGAVVGANGLDTGALGNNILYAVWVIGSSTNDAESAGLLSTSFTDPVLPANYDMARRVGAVLTSGAAAILDFTQRGDGHNRDMWYGAAVATDIVAGQSAVFAAVNCTASVPSVAKEIFVRAALTADGGATRTLALRSGDSSSAAGQVFLSSAAGVVTTASLRTPCEQIAVAGQIDYILSNALASVALSVSGYMDVI